MNATTTTRNNPKSYDNSLVEKIEAIVKEGNLNKSWDKGYYIIDTTGRYEVYFTLYKFISIPPNSLGFINPYRYIKNITTDFAKLEIQLNKLISNPLPIVIANTENNDPKVCDFRIRKKVGVPMVTMGKHRGKTIAQIWDEDRNWVMWFAKTYKVGTYTDFRGSQRNYVLNEEDILLKNNANDLIEAFFEELTITNRETCKSNFIGELKKRMVVEAKIISIRKGDYSTTINLVTECGDYATIYDKEYKLNVGDSIKFKGTPTKNFEKVGKKTTYFNRIEIL
jgi:hypothetical protein